jgi:glycosyltransferase involved in cell wall biosynthesis
VGLPKDKKIVLFGAINPTQDERKGYSYLIEALDRLARKGNNNELALAILGTSKLDKGSKLALPVHCLGYIEDVARLVNCYSAADVFVAPSREDNFPSTVLESLACGIPVVAFNIGGIPDLVEHMRNGYLANPFDAMDLADGIEWIMHDPSRYEGLSKRARQKVEEEFTVGIQVREYLRLYGEILSEDIGHHAVL